MLFRHLQKLVDHVAGKVKCPNCQHVFSDPNIVVQRIQKGAAVLGSKCPQCSESITINVQPKPADVHPGREPGAIHPPLNPEEITHIAEDLSHFTKGDIRDLLS